MASTKSIFSDSLAILVRDLLVSISELSKTSPGPLTVEQMEAYLSLPKPAPRMIPIPAAQMTTAPRRTTTAVVEPESSQICVHVFQRGPRRNLQCDKPALQGDKYCKQCSRSVTNSKKPKSGSKPSKSSGLMLDGHSADGEESEDDLPEVSAKKIPGSQNMYCESRYNFVYHTLPNGNLELMGKMVDDVIVAVTSGEIAIAEDDYGFLVTANTKRL